MPIAYWNLGDKSYSSGINTKDYYMIKLKNDSTIKVYAEIDLADSIHSLLIKEKKKIVRRIYPTETKYIVALGEKNLRVAGNPNDSCWIFKQLDDSISLYSVVPNNGTEYSIFFTKKGSDLLYALNEKNLLETLGKENEKIFKLIKSNDYVKAVKAFNKTHSTN